MKNLFRFLIGAISLPIQACRTSAQSLNRIQYGLDSLIKFPGWVLIVLCIASCRNDSPTGPPEDKEKPTVAIHFPEPGTLLKGDTLYTISADAADNTSVTHVDFLVGGLKVGSDTLPPFECQWSTHGCIGLQTLSAVAYDAAGNFKNSAVISVTVLSIVDYWPWFVGNTWTFKYSSSLRNWDTHVIGAPIEGAYNGTLTWEVVSVSQNQGEVKSTFRQRYVGNLSELRVRSSIPNDFVAVNYDVVDTAYSFDLTVGADSIMRISAVSYPTWESSLDWMFRVLDARRYHLAASASDSLSYSGAYESQLTLVPFIGPRAMAFSYGGNSTRYALSAELTSCIVRTK